ERYNEPPHSPRGREGPPSRMRVALWDPEHPQAPIATLIDAESDPIRFRKFAPLVAFSPDGRTVATAWLQRPEEAETAEPPVTLWDAEDGTVRSRLGDPTALVTALALGPDGLVAA